MTLAHHDCPPCPRCASRVATPAMYARREIRSDDPRDLWCPACGETWRETDGRARGRAWAAWCAWLDRQERDEADERTRVKRERDERRMAEMRRRDGTDR